VKRKRKGREKTNKSTSHKQLTAKYIIAGKVCDGHCNGISGCCVLCTLIPDMYA